MTASYLIDKIMNFYGVSTLTELSKKLDIGQPAITKWKKNNSIMAIKKRCRELGIYNEIFGNLEIYQDLELGRRFYSDEEIKQMEKESNEGYIQYLELQNRRLNKIPYSLMGELELLFDVLNNKDESIIKKVTYQIEDYLVDLKKRLRE